jgi:hypothetical protein
MPCCLNQAIVYLTAMFSLDYLDFSAIQYYSLLRHLLTPLLLEVAMGCGDFVSSVLI